MGTSQIVAYRKISPKLINQSTAQSYTTRLAERYSMGSMRTIEEIRRIRLKMLVKEAGSAAALNRAAERNERDSTISQILNQAAGTSGKPKELGSSMARDLEKAMGKPRGWMDNDPDLVAAQWPFKEITPDQYELLSNIERAKIEERALIMIEGKIIKSPRKNAVA